jgi:predicted ATPase
MINYLTRFRVIGLHGSRTMDVHLADNKLVLVGENGTGKSTFANLIYFFLTKQWARLQEYQFQRIHAEIAEHELILTPEHLEQQITRDRQLQSFFRMTRAGHRSSVSADFASRITDFLAEEGAENERALINRMSDEFAVPRSMAREFVVEYVKGTKGKLTHVQALERTLSSLEFGQFLYLPTYRRIEQDLRSIFRGVDIEAELKKFRERLKGRIGAPFIELVEFGMEDVEQTIATRMDEIEKSVRRGLSNLTGTYLRDVIRGVHTKIDVSAADSLDSQTLEAVFARIDEATLPTQDKKHLTQKVEAISNSHQIEEQDKVIAHFLLKLIELYTQQQASEKDVKDFAILCNQYLTGKQMVYDNTKYAMFLRQKGIELSEEPKTLEMRALSSGEKQIVSLFSHLYLSGQSRFFVIIDEPELSLSVPWQRRFLPDILSTGMCSGLVAVTHSPFVWDNELEPYVRALAEFSTDFASVN